MTLVFCGRRNFVIIYFSYGGKNIETGRKFFCSLFIEKKIEFFDFILTWIEFYLFIFFIYFISSRWGINIWIKFLIGIRMLCKVSTNYYVRKQVRKCNSSLSLEILLSIVISFPISTSTFRFHIALFSSTN